MIDKQRVENQVEELRLQMYQAYINCENYEQILHISQKLDSLLNKLELLK